MGSSFMTGDTSIGASCLFACQHPNVLYHRICHSYSLLSEVETSSEEFRTVIEAIVVDASSAEHSSWTQDLACSRICKVFTAFDVSVKLKAMMEATLASRRPSSSDPIDSLNPRRQPSSLVVRARLDRSISHKANGNVLRG